MSLGGHPPTSTRLGESRWHFQHGPIDLIVDVHGDPVVSEQAVGASWRRFVNVLPELVAELRSLRRPVGAASAVRSPVGHRMQRACAPFAGSRFVTSMAAVAGAVADEMVEYFRCEGIKRASINNGGDIALHLAPGEVARVGICANSDAIGLVASGESGRRDPRLDGRFVISAAMPVRGIATSGWRGRSQSLGIADGVTVLARNAAAADAAATLIANAVNCDHPQIIRQPADTVKDDSDLGSRLVTVAVPRLSPAWRRAALLAGRREAEHWLRHDLIHAAALFLQGEVDVVMPPAAIARVSSTLDTVPERLFA